MITFKTCTVKALEYRETTHRRVLGQNTEMDMMKIYIRAFCDIVLHTGRVVLTEGQTQFKYEKYTDCRRDLTPHVLWPFVFLKCPQCNNTIKACPSFHPHMIHQHHKIRGQPWFIRDLFNGNQRRCPRSSESSQRYHSEWIFSVREIRDGGDGADMGERSLRGVNSCETVCGDASDASEAGGARAYSALFDFPLWMSATAKCPRLKL